MCTIMGQDLTTQMGTNISLYKNNANVITSIIIKHNMKMFGPATYLFSFSHFGQEDLRLGGTSFI